MALTIGIDVGGTKIAAGVVDESGNILTMSRKATPAHDSEAILATIVTAVEDLRRVNDVAAIGIGAPGFINPERTTVVFAPNVGWIDEPIAAKVNEATGLPTYLENDANAAAWGEFAFGAAKSRRSAVVITVGTGIGGGIIIDGHLIRGSYGFGGEIGHLNLIQEGLQCGCGLKGCWEQYSSGSALVRTARSLATSVASSERATRLIELAGGDGNKITGLNITQAAREGDELAIECFNEVGKWLGQGMADLAAILDPEVFVIAGGVSEAGDLLRDPVEDSFKHRVTASGQRAMPPVVLAQLGNEAGIIGAADLARLELDRCAN